MMSESLKSEPSLFIPFDEKYGSVADRLAARYGISFYNIRFNASVHTYIHIHNGNMRSLNTGNGYGFSVYAFKNGGFGFATSNSISVAELERVFTTAAKMAEFNSKWAAEKFEIEALDPVKVFHITPQKKNILDIPTEDKVSYLIERDRALERYSSRIVDRSSVYIDGISHKITLTSDGRLIETYTARSRLVFSVKAVKNGLIQSGHKHLGITGGFEITEMEEDPALEAAEEAVAMLDAEPVKAGKYDIIADPYLTGTFIHEAFGHACEADSVLEHSSILEGRLNTKVGPEHITVIDDPTVPGNFGSIGYDSEGVKAERVVLVENGVLKNFLHSRESAARMKAEPNGHGRAQSFYDIPQVRMTSTFIKEGDMSLEELKEELGNGLLCIKWKYGYTTPHTGEFVFTMSRGIVIENGEEKGLIRDAAMSGYTLQTLNNIVAVSRETGFDDGYCGKNGQDVPVTSGGPYILIKDVNIGGQ